MNNYDKPIFLVNHTPLGDVKTNNLFVWAPVHESGEVEMEIKRDGDELHKLVEG